MPQSDEPPVALITGGARRIGTAIVKSLHRKGYRVAIHFRSSATDAHTVAEHLNQQRSKSALAFSADLSDSAAPKALISDCIQQFGRLDALVNNASVFFPTPLSAPASTTAWALTLDVNLRAPYLLSHAARTHLINTRGCIFNLIDLYAERPLADHPVYVASKAGLAGLTRALARDLGADGVRVNGISPGAILWPQGDDKSATLAANASRQQTILERTPLGRKGTVQDIADTACFLITDAPFISGQIITVDGGRGITP